MNKEQYNKLNDISKIKKLITAYDLKDTTDRTLLYGYTCERNTWHVYMQQNYIYTVIYGFKEYPELLDVSSNYEYVPDKRLYPERCDYEFSKLLKEQGIALPFTTWEDNIEKKVYYGETL